MDLQTARMLKLRCCRYCGDVQERKTDFIEYTRGDAKQILRKELIYSISLGEENSKIFSESERIRICIENSGETASMQMTVEVVAVDIHRRTRHLNYQYRAVVNF